MTFAGVRIAVIMTAHNRAMTTQRCLNSLRFAVRQIPDARVRVFLTDDGCTDDTVVRAHEAWQDIEIILGNGNLYWAAGMAAAESRAIRWEPEFFLWLNDDVVLLEDSLTSLLDTATFSRSGIAFGATRDPHDGVLTYGGARISGRHPQRVSILGSSAEIQHADTFHGNIVLIPKVVHDRVGLIDGRFEHGYADFDYGLRASRMGVPVMQAPGFAGECQRNPQPTKFSGSVRERWRAAQDPVTGLPWRSQTRYLRRHAGVEWPLYAVWSVVHRFIRG